MTRFAKGVSRFACRRMETFTCLRFTEDSIPWTNRRYLVRLDDDELQKPFSFPKKAAIDLHFIADRLRARLQVLPDGPDRLIGNCAGEIVTQVLVASVTTSPGSCATVSTSF